MVVAGWWLTRFFYFVTLYGVLVNAHEVSHWYVRSLKMGDNQTR